MTHCKMFVAALALLVTAMTACAPNSKEKSISAAVNGDAGNFLIIKGHGFSEDKNQNKVNFGGVPAQVLRADADYLLVQVPAQSAATVPVIVVVGKHVSNAMLFEYHANLVAARQ